MEQVTYACMTDGCQRQGQATFSRWCQACGLPNEAGSNAGAAESGQPPWSADPVGPAARAASSPVSADGRGSGAVAITVVVALTAVVLLATHSLLGIGGSDSSASASVAATYPYEVETDQTEPSTEPPATEPTEDTANGFGETSPTETFTTEDPATTDTTISGPPTELASSASASASVTAPDSKDDAGTVVSYEAERLLDGDSSTAWRAKGDGQGLTVTITLAGPAHITEVGLIPGYDKTDPVSGKNRFFQDHRISEVTWRFDDGNSVDQQFADDPSMQRQAVDVTSATVTIEIVATLPSEPGFDYTPISDVSIMGTSDSG
jgi:hypothetical protein